MGKTKTARSTERSDKGYIRKLCRKKHPNMNIKETAVEDLDVLADELFDQIVREASDLLRLNSPFKSTLTVRELDTYAKMTFPPDLYKKVSDTSADAVFKYAAHLKHEPKSPTPE